MTDILAAVKGIMWMVVLLFALLLFGKELRPLVEILVSYLTKVIT